MRSLSTLQKLRGLLICAIAMLGGQRLLAVDTVTVYASQPTASEIGLVPGQFTFFRSSTSQTPVTITYSISGTAVAGVRYAALSGSVTILAGQQFATVDVTPLVESTIEGGQTVDVSISASALYITGNPYFAEVAIADKDLTATTAVGKLVSAKPGVNPSGGTVSTDPNNVSVIRVEFNNTSVDRGGYVNFGGTAVPGKDYKLLYVLGHDTVASSGNLFDAGRLSYDGTIVNGTDQFNVNDPASLGYGAGRTSITLQCGHSIGTNQGLYAAGDLVTFGTDTTVYEITGATAPSSGSASATQAVTIAPSLSVEQLNGTQVHTAPEVPLSASVHRPFMFLPGGAPYNYNHVEWMIVPLVNTTVTGALTVTLTLESSDDYSITNPTAATVFIAENNVILSTQLTSNAVRGGSVGSITINSSSAFPNNITIPFTTTGTAAPGTDYTFPNQVIVSATSAFGTAVLTAGTTSVTVPITAPATGVTGNQTVTLTLQNSLDYSLQGGSGSVLNPSATLNIDDSLTTVVTPGTTSGGTTGSSASSTSASTGATVRPLPTNSGSKSCGLGGGAALLGLALGAFVRLRRRRA